MKLSYHHGTTRQAARAKIDEAATKAVEVGGSQLQDVKREWQGDTLAFSFLVLGKTIRGTAEVTDTEVIVEAGLPLMFQPFEGRAKSRILQSLDEMYR